MNFWSAPRSGIDRLRTSRRAAHAPNLPTARVRHGRGRVAPWHAETVPRLPFPREVRELLSHPNPAIIATVRPDGQPLSVATWSIMDGDRVLMNMDASRRRLAYVRDDPRVSLTVLDRDDWSTHVSMQGRIVEI